MSRAIPFEAIRVAAFAQADRLLRDWFPHGRIVGREFKIGDLQGRPGESLSINLTTGKWADFAEGVAGHDIIDLLAATTYRGDRIRAARELGKMLGIDATSRAGKSNGKTRYNRHAVPDHEDWQPTIPPPANVPKPAPSHFDGYDITYEYCDLDDRLLFYVRRREATGGKRKQFHPLVYGVLNGEKGWHSKHPPIPKPLYGLNRLTMLPDATVLLCEGEKAANAAQMIFPEFACVSWCGGAKAAQYADVSPLAERDVLVWPDNDVEGHSAAADLRKMLPQVRVLRVKDLPPGGDAADIYPEDPEAWLRAHLPAEDRRETNLPAFLTAEEWLKRDFSEAEPLLGELVVAGVRMFIVGRTGLGKTLLGFALAVAMASGSPFLHWKAGRPCRVLYIDGEMPGPLIRQRLRDALRRAGLPDLGGRLTIFARDLEEEIATRFPGLGAFQPLNMEAGHKWVLTLIDLIGGVDVLVLDNVMSLLEGVQKEEEAWTGANPLVASLSRRQIAQIWLDHTGHAGDKQYGTSTKSWRFDAVGIMTPVKQDCPQRGASAFCLSFEPPHGKCRRRTQENWQNFESRIIRLHEDRWTSETAESSGRGFGKVSPSRVPFYDALMAAIRMSAATPGRCAIKGWQSECLHRGLIEKAPEHETAEQRDTRFKGFRRAKADLIAAKFIAIEGEQVVDLKGCGGEPPNADRR